MFAIFCCFEGKGSDTGMKHAFSHVSCPCSLSVISKCNSTKNCAFLLNKTAPYKISRLTKCLLINRIVESIINFLNLAPLIIFCQAYAVGHQLREVIFLKHDNQS